MVGSSKPSIRGLHKQAVVEGIHNVDQARSPQNALLFLIQVLLWFSSSTTRRGCRCVDRSTGSSPLINNRGKGWSCR